jgi:hypothetical protein
MNIALLFSNPNKRRKKKSIAMNMYTNFLGNKQCACFTGFDIVEIALGRKKLRLLCISIVDYN